MKLNHLTPSHANRIRHAARTDAREASTGLRTLGRGCDEIARHGIQTQTREIQEEAVLLYEHTLSAEALAILESSGVLGHATTPDHTGDR